MSRSFESTSFTTLPSIAMVPDVISSRPASMRSSVDLPQPDGPTSTMNSPSAMSKLMPWMTFVVPKDFSMLLNVTDAMASAVEGLMESGFDGAGREAGHHVTLERVVDGRGRERIDQARGHQELPR